MTFLAYRFGASDPTYRIDERGVNGTSLTNSGEVSFRVTREPNMPPALNVCGPGQEAWIQRKDNFLGRCDTFTNLDQTCAGWQEHHSMTGAVAQKVKKLEQKWSHQRIGGSGDTYKAALVATLGQRITVVQAVAQWRDLCRKFGRPAHSGENLDAGAMYFAPQPEVLASLAPYQLHPIGIEEKRAKTIIHLGRFFSRPGMLDADSARTAILLEKMVVGFGPWSSALVRREAAGDCDAVAVGDFHVKNTIAHFFTGAPRGTDDQMMQTLEPFYGQRGRIVEWLRLEGVHAPQYGPRKALFSISRL
jgi:3-methyladenine DNA glycosylase/8-oxoguanine DNA glycosylase